MTRRKIVKDAIAHKKTERVPYCIAFTPDAEKELQKVIGDRSAIDFADNDIIQVRAPWWDWKNLGPEWKEPAVPLSVSKVTGMGNYEVFFDTLKKLRDNSDKYISVMVYGSHFEKANAARGIENFLADLSGEPVFAKKLLTRIIEKNMVMLENFLSAREIDGVLLGSDWGSQIDLLMSPATWEDMMRPGEQREHDLVHGYGKDLWIHSCGNVVKKKNDI